MKHLIQTILLAVVLLSLFSTPVNASFDKALEIYHEKRFDEAKVAFEALAAIADAGSLFNLGVMYYRGEGVGRDVVRAQAMMSIAGDSLEESSFADTAKKIYSTFNEAQKIESESLLAQLRAVYDPSVLKQTIFPKPLSDKDCPPELLPVLKVAPRYPRSEQLQGRMGFTDLEFTVSDEGYVRDIHVTSSSNPNFAKTSYKAAIKFRYAPRPAKTLSFGVKNRFTYVLENNGETKVKTRTLKRKLGELKDNADSGDVVAQYRYGKTLNAYRSFEEYLKDVDLQYREANDWFLKSAQGGLPNAQFEIGRNMLQGRGCAIDEENGLKWINASATGGYSPAQTLLAQRFIDQAGGLEKDKALVVSWLRNASLSDHYPASVMLAWKLATSESPGSSGREALELLDGDDKSYYDPVRVMETRAEAHAQLGDFKKALKYQEKAMEQAEKLDWVIPVMEERLAAYQQRQRLLGDYF